MRPAIHSPGHSPARLVLAVLVVVATSPAAATGQRDIPAPFAPWSLQQSDLTAALKARPGLFVPQAATARSPRAAAFAHTPGSPDDARWQTGFGLPVPDGPITALMPNDGRLVVGGWFRRIGDLEVPGIATWDGSNWSALGSYPGYGVMELATYPGGLLAIANSPVVYRWDGTSWSSLPSFPSSVVGVMDLATVGDTVAVAALIAEGGHGGSGVLLLTDSGWTMLGGVFAGQLNALAWHDGALYAGGYIDSLDATAISPVVRWDGSAWQSVGPPRPMPQSYVWDLAVFGGELVAGGAFHDEADPSAYWLAERWDGTQWTGLGQAQADFSGSLWRLRTLDSDLFALGQFWSTHPSGIARWDGSAWHVGEDSLQVFVRDIADYQGEKYAGGHVTTDGSRPAPGLVREKSGGWEAVLAQGAPMHGLLASIANPDVRALVPMGGAIVAGGRFEFAGNDGEWIHTPGVARWDGARWTSLGLESFRSHYLVDLVMHEGALHALGGFWTDQGPGHAARFDNGEWRLVGPGSPLFSTMYCGASALGMLVVGGYKDDIYAGLAYWNGQVWDRLGGGITSGNWITAITAHGDQMIVGGLFEELGHVPLRNIAAWTASGWHSLGEGLDGSVNDLLSVNGTLYAAGYFRTNEGGWTGVMAWKGGHWEPVRGVGSAWTLGWSRGRLIASGDGLPGLVAVLEADSTWHPLGSGLDGPALSIVEQGSSLFFGGLFSQSGGHAAYGFAEYRQDPLPPSGNGLLVSAAPNPSAETVTLRYDLAIASQARVEIFDLAGKLVDRPFTGFQSAGPQEVVWRPAPDRVRAGVYFARLITVEGSRVVRVVRVQ